MIMGDQADANPPVPARGAAYRPGRIASWAGPARLPAVTALLILALSACASTGAVDWDSAPPAGQSSAGRGKVSVLVVAWGTPSDEGVASKGEERDYSRRLAGLVETVVHDIWGESLHSVAGIPTTAEFRRLVTDPSPYTRTAGLCRDHAVQAIFMVRVEHSEYLGTGMGYASWREPYFALFDCTTASRMTEHPRVYDRPGEAFPYASELGIAYRRFVLKRRRHLAF